MSETKIIRPHQGFQELFVRTNVDVAFGGGVLAAGKDVPLDMPVLTPNGWVKNGDLKVGDYVNTPFGNPAKILQVFDHYNRQVYWLHTNDGRCVECSAEHLWAIRTPKQLEKYRNKHKVGENLTVCQTSEIIERLGKGLKTYIPTPHAQEFSEKTYLIAPYAMGVLIGDGCLTDSAWNENKNCIIISNNEDDIISRFYGLVGGTRIYKQQSNYNRVVYTPNAKAYYQYCKEVGLCTYSYLKRIPREYLYGSIAQRRLLLSGLMDTDGTVDKKGTYRYSTTSYGLVQDFVELCRSLGYIARVHKDKRSLKYTTNVCYNISISTCECIVSSEKHLDKYNKYLATNRSFTREYKHVYVTKIEKSRICDTRCILVDDPIHLYITKDYLTTHNTFGAALATAEPSLDPDWRGLVVKNNIDDLKRGGGVIDTFSKELYGTGAVLRMSEMPRLTFPSGAWVDFAHLADQSVDAIQRRFKSSQYDWIYFDELTGFTWDAFKTLLTRNRGKSAYAGKCLATTNPERESWIRDFIDWYIDDEGFIMPERSGIVRYFYMMGSDVKDVVWGNTKEEVYRQCKSDIDKKLDKVYGFMNGRDKWKTMIKSFTFYLGRISENKEMLENNEGYVGSIAMTGGAEAAKLLEGNWNVSSRDDEDNLLTFDEANSVFTNEPQRNGDKWITADLADFGTDNFLQLAWDGLHIIDIDIAPHTTPKENADRMKMFANKHNVAYKHIIFDGVRGRYINDYIPEAIPFESYRAPFGVNALQYVKLKDCCYGKLIWLIKNNLISCTDEVARRIYTHQLLKSDIRIQDEFVAEARVVRFIDGLSGKKRLMTKKEMNKKLGRGRSMDLLDPTAMRMYPLLDIADGYELESSRRDYEREQEALSSGEKVDIYDETNWY